MPDQPAIDADCVTPHKHGDKCPCTDATCAYCKSYCRVRRAGTRGLTLADLYRKGKDRGVLTPQQSYQ